MVKRKEEWSEFGDHMMSILHCKQTCGSTPLRTERIDGQVLDDDNHVICGCKWRSLTLLGQGLFHTIHAPLAPRKCS